VCLCVCLCVYVCVSATIIGASELFQKYYPSNMTVENLKKFKILSDGDTNMTGKTELNYESLHYCPHEILLNLKV